MFKPHVTVACVVQAEGQFLVVEETIHGQPHWNQPSGHLEADKTPIEAAQLELWEEAGIHALPQALLCIHQWIAPDKTPFLRFLFAIDMPRCVTAIPQDDDIDRCLWLPAASIIASDRLRLPLDLLQAFNSPF